MKARSRQVLSTLAGLVGVVLVVAGCASTDAQMLDDAASPTASAVRTENPDAVETGEHERAEASGDCLTGSWKLVNETFEEGLARLVRDSPELPADLRAGLTLTLSGDSHLRFDGNSLFTAWQDDFTITITSHGQEIRHVINSADAATYTADHEYTWVTDYIPLSYDAAMHIEGIGTITVDEPDPTLAQFNFFGFTGSAPAFDRELVDGAARYECSTDTLILHADEGISARFTRIAPQP